MKKVLITGASGFIGRHLIEELIAQEIEVIALYCRSELNFLLQNDKVKWIKLDLSINSIDSHLCGVDTIFHLAGYSGQGNDAETLRKLDEINVCLTRKVANSACNAKIKLIYVSSISASDGDPRSTRRLLIDEYGGRAFSEYGRSKRRAEHVLQNKGLSGLNYIVLRPTQLFGEHHSGSILELTRAILARKFIIIGSGNNLTAFYYIKDFVNSMLTIALIAETKHHMYILAPTPISLNELSSFIASEIGVKVARIKLPLSMGLFMAFLCDFFANAFGFNCPLSRRRVFAMTRDIIYCSERFKSEIGPTVKHGTLGGLVRTIKWYQSHGLL